MAFEILKPWYVYKPSNIIRRLFSRKPQARSLENVKMAWGGQLEFDIAGSIGWGAKTTGVVDLALSEVVCNLVRKGDSVLDVGANVGGITYLLARLVGKNGTVDAFEPHPVVHQILKRNRTLNLGHWGNQVALHEVAVGSSRGKVRLLEDPDAASDGQASFHLNSKRSISHDVQMVRLDQAVNYKRYSLMKLDVEGHELQVLEGAGRLLDDKSIENILFEDHEGPTSRVFDFLTRKNYFVYSFGWELNGVRIVPIAEGNLNKEFEAPNYWASGRKLEKDFFPGWKSFRQIEAG
jgi:FkbM family methyltransferase